MVAAKNDVELGTDDDLGNDAMRVHFLKPTDYES